MWTRVPAGTVQLFRSLKSSKNASPFLRLISTCKRNQCNLRKDAPAALNYCHPNSPLESRRVIAEWRVLRTSSPKVSDGFNSHHLSRRKRRPASLDWHLNPPPPSADWMLELGLVWNGFSLGCGCYLFRSHGTEDGGETGAVRGSGGTNSGTAWLSLWISFPVRKSHFSPLCVMSVKCHAACDVVSAQNNHFASSSESK